MFKIPGLAVTRKTRNATQIKTTGRRFLYVVFVTFKIIISIDNGKKTEPRYAIRLYQSAASRLYENARKVYPIFTTSTDENNKIIQVLFLRTKKRQPIKSNKDKTAATP